MSLPVKEKNWLYTVNQTVGLNSNYDADSRDYMFKIKNTLTGFGLNPFTVWGSSNATSYDSGGGTDYWQSTGDVNWGFPGSAHSWIVLECAAKGANYAFCIDLQPSNFNYKSFASWVVSPTAGFTGGTVGDRPTATDEIVLETGSGLENSGAHTGKLHAWHSSDGECTRFLYMRGGVTQLLMILDVPKAPLASWSPANISGNKRIATCATYANWNDSAKLRGRLSSTFDCYMTCEGWADGAGGQRVTVPDDDTGEWPIMPIGLASGTAGHRGAQKGALYDLWWGSPGLSQADTFPADTSKQFVIFDDMVFPWNGSVPLIS